MGHATKGQSAHQGGQKQVETLRGLGNVRSRAKHSYYTADARSQAEVTLRERQRKQ